MLLIHFGFQWPISKLPNNLEYLVIYIWKFSLAKKHMPKMSPIMQKLKLLAEVFYLSMISQSHFGPVDISTPFTSYFKTNCSYWR